VSHDALDVVKRDPRAQQQGRRCVPEVVRRTHRALVDARHGVASLCSPPRTKCPDEDDRNACDGAEPSDDPGVFLIESRLVSLRPVEDDEATVQAYEVPDHPERRAHGAAHAARFDPSVGVRPLLWLEGHLVDSISNAVGGGQQQARGRRADRRLPAYLRRHGLVPIRPEPGRKRLRWGDLDV
jgi:hypothetical protein